MTDLIDVSPVALPTLARAPLPPLDQDPRLVYLASLAASSKQVVDRRLNQVAHLFGLSAAQFPWASLRYTHMVAIRHHFVAQDLAPATINLTLAALRGVAREAWRLGYLDVDAYERIRDVPAVRGERLLAGRSFSAGELHALLAVCAADVTPTGVRDGAIIAMLYSTGVRRAELATLDLADWVPASAMLQVRHGKGNKQRQVYLSEGAVAALDDWLGVRGTTRPGRLFAPINKGRRIGTGGISAQTVRDIIERRAAQAHIEPISPHDFRRTVAGDLLDRQTDLVTVQKILGHANVQTTARYDRRDERAKQKAVGTLHVPYVKRNA